MKDEKDWACPHVLGGPRNPSRVPGRGCTPGGKGKPVSGSGDLGRGRCGGYSSASAR